jgi:16S rRNA (guanine966-N2)-methyltransferase
VKAQRKAGYLRIIGGTWRSRRIPFAVEAGVRPTPDRVRETLFNWLQPVIEGARCLDLYCGSGALSFEALSRGADLVVMVDEDLRVIQQLQNNIELLKTDHARVEWSDALQFLAGNPQPPFRDNVLTTCCHRLESLGWLTTGARIYIEASAGHVLSGLPDNWAINHHKTAGQVAYYLAMRNSRQDDNMRTGSPHIK